MFNFGTYYDWYNWRYMISSAGCIQTLPLSLPVAPTAFTPMWTLHETRGHRWRLRWYTSGFL